MAAKIKKSLSGLSGTSGCSEIRTSARISDISKEELEKRVIELGEQDITAEKIGLALAKEFNVKARKALGKRISQILKEKNLYTSPDIKNLKLQVEKLKKHLSKNSKDFSSSRTLLIQEARLRKLEKIEAR